MKINHIILQYLNIIFQAAGVAAQACQAVAVSSHNRGGGSDDEEAAQEDGEEGHDHVDSSKNSFSPLTSSFDSPNSRDISRSPSRIHGSNSMKSRDQHITNDNQSSQHSQLEHGFAANSSLPLW